MVAGGTLSRLLFQGVRPVIRSISPQMIQVSCAWNAGSVSWFPMGLVWAGGAPPLGRQWGDGAADRVHWSWDQSADSEVVGLMGRPTGYVGVMNSRPTVWFG